MNFFSKNKLLFFLISTIFLSTLFAIPVYADTDVSQEFKWDTVKVDSTWLTVKANPFVDKSTSDGTGQFRMSSGGIKLVDFTDEGVLKNDNGTIAYRASAEFEFALNWYTTVDIKDAFPNSDLQNWTSFQYVKIRKFTSVDIFGGGYNGEEFITGELSFRSIKLGSQKAHDYDGHIPIDLTIQQDFQGRTIEFNGYKISNLKVFSEIKQVVIKETRKNPVGEYNDEFKRHEQIDTSVSVDKKTPSLGLSGTKSAQVGQEISNLDLGIEPVGYSTGLTYLGGDTGQASLVAEPSGTTFHNLQSDDEFSFNLPARARPGVTYDKERIKTRWAFLNWDYQDFLGSAAGVWVVEGPTTRYQDRIAAVKIRQKFCQQVFKVKTNFIAEGELEFEEGGEDLDDPVVDNGDIVWDEDPTGTSDIEIPLYTNLWLDFLRNIFANPINLIITIVIIIAIAFIIYLLIKQIQKQLFMYSVRKAERAIRGPQTRPYRDPRDNNRVQKY